MIEHYGKFKDSVSNIIEVAQTSKKALVAEGVGTLVGFSGAFTIDRPIPALILGAVGFGSAMTGLANIEYQDAVHWQAPQPGTNQQHPS